MLPHKYPTEYEIAAYRQVHGHDGASAIHIINWNIARTRVDGLTAVQRVTRFNTTSGRTND